MKSNISLFINTAAKGLQFGILDDIRQVNNPHLNASFINMGDSKKALENSFTCINTLLKESDLTLKDVSKFYALLGPGSNTGIRLGLTIIKTIYGINPEIKMYGINTLKVFLQDKNDIALLSDRASNLFIGYYVGDDFINERIDKANIYTDSRLINNKLFIDASDETTYFLLKDKYDVNRINVIENMITLKDKFDDFSKNEENFLPIYQVKI